MGEKILFLDDDEALLAGIRRGLRKHFEIDTAHHPDVALEMLSSRGPYAVIVADMNMPLMNGVTFLVEARRISPDSIRMMLTGSASLETALRAINDGNVFRFITKPCPTPALKKTLEAGLHQHRLLEAEKRAALLEETNRAKSKFLTTVSHELRTPLTILRLSTEILERYGREDERVRDESLGAIEAQTLRLGDIVDQVLDMTQLEAGLISLAEERVDLGDLLEQVVSGCSDGSRTYELDVDGSEGPAVCVGDRRRLRQVIEELLGNARKFSPQETAIEVGLHRCGDAFELTIRDFGPGVPAEELDDLFEAFVQRDEVVVDKPPGLGLGLAIVKGLLELHAADIRYRDAPGGGALFVVRIPAVVQAETAAVSNRSST